MSWLAWPYHTLLAQAFLCLKGNSKKIIQPYTPTAPPGYSLPADPDPHPVVKQPLSYNRMMLWAAFCLGFFGFMHSGGFTNLLSQHPDTWMLSVADVAIDSRQNPQILTVLIHRSKTDQSGDGTHLYLGQTSNIPMSRIHSLGIPCNPPSHPWTAIFISGWCSSKQRSTGCTNVGCSLSVGNWWHLFFRPQFSNWICVATVQQRLASTIPLFRHWEGGNQM